jgi:lysophospholipase L1-like esterase
VQRIVAFAFFALAVLATVPPPGAGFLATESSEAAPVGPAAPAPGSMDALGDSFTRGLYSGDCGTTASCANNSWSTGTTASVQSHYQRLVALNPALSGHAVNRAVSAKKMDYLDTEVKAALPDAPAYVTIMIGLNDVCGGGLTPATMTAPSDVGAQFRTAMSDLTSHLPAVRVFVASIPNPYWLWQILHTNASATSAWTTQQVCPAMLQNPTSMALADISRRAMVLQRVVDDNAQIRQVCGEFTQCLFDDDAVFNWQFTAGDVNTGDYFHPSLQGQADLAAVTYQPSYNFGAPGAALNVSLPDTTPPLITAFGRSVRLSRRGSVSFLAASNEPATGSVSATITVPNSPKRLRFGNRAVTLPANVRQKITLTLARRNAAKARAFLKKGRRLTVRVTLALTDAAGNGGANKLTLKLKRETRKASAPLRLSRDRRPGRSTNCPSAYSAPATPAHSLGARPAEPAAAARALARAGTAEGGLQPGGQRTGCCPGYCTL